MNIAFEISPLITASGTFGDKSGVYRYMYGLLTALIEKVKKDDSKSIVVLFSFAPNLLTSSLNPEISRLVDNKRVFILGYTNDLQMMEREENVLSDIIAFPLIKIPLKIIDAIFHVRYTYSRLTTKWVFQNYVKELKKEFHTLNIDVVIHSETGFYYLEDFKNVITVYDVTTILLPYLHREATRDLQERKLEFAKKFCDGIIVISESTKKDLQKYSKKFKKKKVVVAYPGMNSQLLANKKTIEQLNKLLIPHQNTVKYNKYFLYYGTFEPRKNIVYIVRAFAELAAKGVIPRDMKLVLIGGKGWGDVKEQVLHFIEETEPNKIESQFIVLDFLSDPYLASFIRNAYALVYPSLYEGFGLPVLEAMTLGTPVITSNSSSLPEVGGGAVAYVKPKDYSDIKKKMKYMVQHPDYAKRLKSRGKIQSKKFSWNQSAETVYNFIEKL